LPTDLKRSSPTLLVLNKVHSSLKRLISDNTILAYEAFHFLKNYRNKKNSVVGIKLDMEKTYDRVKWNCLEDTLLTMGFPTKLVHTIMICVRSVFFCPYKWLSL